MLVDIFYPRLLRILDAIVGDLDPLAIGELARKAQALEDRPRPDALVEDADEIAALLDL